MIVQDGGTLAIMNPTKRYRHMTIPLQPDGSATGEYPLSLANYTVTSRVKVPAGTGPRPFEFLTIANACTVRVDPA